MKLKRKSKSNASKLPQRRGFSNLSDLNLKEDASKLVNDESLSSEEFDAESVLRNF